MATSTVEDYLKAIYDQQQSAGGDLVAMGALAAAMNVAPGTATAMVKTLADAGLVDYERRGGVRLSGKGPKLAPHVLRRHRPGSAPLAGCRRTRTSVAGRPPAGCSRPCTR